MTYLCEELTLVYPSNRAIYTPVKRKRRKEKVKETSSIHIVHNEIVFVSTASKHLDTMLSFSRFYSKNQ